MRGYQSEKGKYVFVGIPEGEKLILIGFNRPKNDSADSNISYAEQELTMGEEMTVVKLDFTVKKQEEVMAQLLKFE